MIVPRWQGFDPVEPGFLEGVFALKKFAFALCAVAAIAGYSQAGIFRKRVTTVTAVQAKPAVAQVKGDTSTAQGVALLIVQTGRFRHFGGYNGFEGIGMGSTPAQAEANCCYRNRFTPRERAFAQTAGGMWVCVCRY